MKNTHNRFPEEAWENRELGASEEYVCKVSVEREQKIEKSLGLQMISLRLQKNLIDELKNLAREAGIGYQPYIRQILTKYIVEESGKKDQRISTSGAKNKLTKPTETRVKKVGKSRIKRSEKTAVASQSMVPSGINMNEHRS